MSDDASTSRILGIAKIPAKFKEGASLTMSGLTLASVMWAVSLLYQNFSKVQDQLSDEQAKTVVLEQQVGALKEKVSDLSTTVAGQESARQQLTAIEMQLAVLKSTTELRLSKIEGVPR